MATEALEEVLLRALQDEYGEDAETWTAMRSLDRVAKKIREHVAEQVLDEVRKEQRWQNELRQRTRHPDTRLSHRYVIERLNTVGGCIKHALGLPTDNNPPRSTHDRDRQLHLAATSRDEGTPDC